MLRRSRLVPLARAIRPIGRRPAGAAGVLKLARPGALRLSAGNGTGGATPLTVADFNGDGNLDLVTANYNSNS